MLDKIGKTLTRLQLQKQGILGHLYSVDLLMSRVSNNFEPLALQKWS